MDLQHRFLPGTYEDKQALMAACGVSSFEDLISSIPQNIRVKNELKVSGNLCEMDLTRKFQKMFENSRGKKGYKSFLGAGVYEHICPAAVEHLTSRGEFLTSYTPYQPEMAQGTLMALYEFQTMVAELFGMDVATASHYDGATAFTEAMMMAVRIKKKRNTVIVSEGVHPEYLQTLRTYAINLGMEIVVCPKNEKGETSLEALKSLLNQDVAGVAVQSPNLWGVVEPLEELAQVSHGGEALFVTATLEPLSLALLKTPGECGADIAVGEGQSFGIPACFGGPYLGLFTAKKEYVRQMPGRLCGETVDAQGRRSFCLTLSTREQHIRREKATSNICSNQNLMALWATIWLSMMGKEGLVDLAKNNLSKAQYAKTKALNTGKVRLRYHESLSFNEFLIDLNSHTKEFIEKCVNEGMAPGVAMSRFNPTDTHGLLVCVTETATREDIDLWVRCLEQWA